METWICSVTPQRLAVKDVPCHLRDSQPNHCATADPAHAAVCGGSIFILPPVCVQDILKGYQPI